MMLASTRARSPLLTPNTQKDLPTSPRMGARGFWGGAHSSFGSITPVHTTLMPEWSSILSGKAAPGRKSPALQENINPALNNSAGGAGADRTKELSLPMHMTPFDSFTDLTPFTLKSRDA